MRSPSIFISFLILVAWQQESFFASGQVHFKKGAPHVRLANGGLISGIVKFSRDGRPYNSFIGIQYAKVIERFQEPVPLLEPTWQGVLSATKPGPMCAQSRFGDSSDLFGEEDCLNLNVYVPMNNTGTGKKGYPVLFWVHGGGFSFGGGLGYGSGYLMDEDVIVVSINYRLGAFGFCSTGDGVISGNLGMKDMVVALQWVQENIGKFGGDPGKVTIFGESAGGSAIHFLLLSPTTKGLFHRAISQSGTALNQWAFNPNPKKLAVELATHLNCPTSATEPSGITSEEIHTCLKGLATEELNKAQASFKKFWPHMRALSFAPSVEPSERVSTLTPFLSEAPISILSRPDSAIPEIPWMVGATEDEGYSMYAGIIVSKPQLLTEINADWENIAPTTFDYGEYLSKDEQSQVSEKLKQFYFGGNEISADSIVPLSNVYSDEMILHGVYRAAIETASRGKRNPVYLYQYAYKGPISLMGSTFQVKGLDANKVGHGDDLQHLFDFGTMNPDADPLIKPDSPDEVFSKNLVSLWASFAIVGEPKHTWGNAIYKKWKPISKKDLDGINPLRWYRIDSNPESVEIDQSVKDRMQFWDNLWTDHLTPAHVKDTKTAQKTEL